MRESQTGLRAGEKHHLFGKHHSEETKAKIRAKLIGHSNSEESNRKRSDAMRGEKCHLWKGGISFEPYCPKFTRSLKERVRKFFGYVCQGCGKTQEKNGEKLVVHHVNYDKMVCCNNVKPLFVPVCRSCHTKTNIHREYWEEIFTKMIMLEHDGVCFSP